MLQKHMVVSLSLLVLVNALERVMICTEKWLKVVSLSWVISKLRANVLLYMDK
nr:hypothetical protein Iba_chr12dCG7200 [Ipomoea batatas]